MAILDEQSRNLLAREELDSEDGSVYDEAAYEKTLPPPKRSAGRILAIVITIICLLMVISLSGVLSDWAKYMPHDVVPEHGHSHEHGSENQDMNMPGMPSIPDIDTSAKVQDAMTFATIKSTVSSVIPTTTFSSVPAPLPTPAENSPADAKAEESLQERYILGADWDYAGPPTRREYYFTVKDAEYNPAGVFRSMILINGQFPGPLIRINEGDTLVVHVDNQASNATSIHWHGLYQNGTNWMDGTVGVTSCAIVSGAQYTYEFQVKGQAGTYWYHAHQGVQQADGLYGPLIVHDRDELEDQKIHYATDRVVMLSDHYYDLSDQLLMTYLASDRENIEPVPDRALINGFAPADCSKVQDRRCDNSTANIGHATFRLDPTMSHRLRFINVGVFAEFQVSIDEHEWAITEVDGTDVWPAYNHRLLINPAQRYSLVITPHPASASSFWMRVKMITSCFGEANSDLNPETFAIVDYVQPGTTGTRYELPQSQDFSEAIELDCKDMDTTDLVPVVEIAAPETPDASFYIRANFEIGAWRLSRGFFNTSSWRADIQRPTLMRSLEGLTSANESFTQSDNAGPFVNDLAFNLDKEMVIQSSGVKVFDLLISNFNENVHPWHAHGQKFWVLAQGHGYPPDNLTETLDLRNPLRRDTASTEPFGWTLLRFVADNPGVWAFHCHISWHSESGLLMQFLTRVDELAKMEVPEASRALCEAPLEALQRGMTPPDEVFYGHIDGRS